MASTKITPKISIIVPVFNVEPYLNTCVDSILNQTFSEFEVILVNDGSTDKSGEICEQYAKQDCRVHIIHKENGGLSSARNAGIAIAEGEFLGFVDSDDYIEKNMYEDLYNLCVNQQSDIAVCKFGSNTDDSLNQVSEIYQFTMNNIEAMEQLFKGVLYRFSVCNKLFKRSCFAGIQFPNGRIHEDLATTYKLFSRANKVIFKNFIGYIYVKRDNSILTSKYNPKRLDSFLAWKEILKFIKEKYPNIYMISITAYTYWCLDNLNYIFQQVENERERTNYLKYIRSNMQIFVGDIIKNKNVPINQRYEIFILNKSIYFYLLLIKMKRLARSW